MGTHYTIFSLLADNGYFADDRSRRDLAYRQSCLERAKSCRVSLYSYQCRQLEQSHGLFPIRDSDDSIWLLADGSYDEETGLSLKGAAEQFWGVNVKNTKYPNVVEFQATGDHALFSDPIMRIGGEKCTYQVPAYEALKGILSSVYWKPTLIWYIGAVRVVSPIQTEVKGVRSVKYHGAMTWPATPVSSTAATGCGPILSGTKTARSWPETVTRTSTMRLPKR